MIRQRWKKPRAFLKILSCDHWQCLWSKICVRLALSLTVFEISANFSVLKYSENIWNFDFLKTKTKLMIDNALDPKFSENFGNCDYF